LAIKVSDIRPTAVKEEELNSRKIMFQFIVINVMIVVMDCGVLAVEFANLYIIETNLKGVQMRQSKRLLSNSQLRRPLGPKLTHLATASSLISTISVNFSFQ
jgi:hypothetical protein